LGICDFFQKIVTDFFSYHTLYILYFITKSKKELEHLKDESSDDNLDNLNQGCLQTLAGVCTLLLLAYILILL